MNVKEWLKSRADQLRKEVSVFDILREKGVHLRFDGQRAEQIHCPFHGSDNKPSARAFPDTENSPSHVWCYVCQEQWDSIKLYGKYHGFEGKFSQLLAQMEKAYQLKAPPFVQTDFEEMYPLSQPPEKEIADYTAIPPLFGLVERRLQDNRTSFELRPYLVLNATLDRLSWAMEHRLVTPSVVKKTLEEVLTKISARVVCRED